MSNGTLKKVLCIFVAICCIAMLFVNEVIFVGFLAIICFMLINAICFLNKREENEDEE